MQYVIYDPESNVYVVVPQGYIKELCDNNWASVTEKPSYATRFTREQVTEYLNKFSPENPWLTERAEVREAP